MIPKPAIERLCRIYTSLSDMDNMGVEFAGSADIEEETGIPAHTVRKDISYLNAPGPGGGKYGIRALMERIQTVLELGRRPRTCVVGLQPPGLMVLEMEAISREFDIVAGFDSNMNLVELTEASVELFPAYMIPEKVRDLKIELAVLAVKEDEVERNLERLIKGGIRGILNYTPVPISKRYGVKVRNMYIPEELRILGVETNI